MLVLVDATPLLVLRMLTTAVIGMVALGAGVSGFWSVNLFRIERLALVVGGMLLVDPGTLTDLIGLGIVGVVYFIQRIRWNREAKALED